VSSVNNTLYPRLAWQNIKKNGKFYFPYLLTIIATAAVFYIVTTLATNADYPDRIRFAYLQSMMWIGCYIIGLFALIVLFYTNSFLMKRRQKELGLYNILGMGKRHIAIILCFEMLYIAILGIGGGLLVGILFYKLVLLVIYKILFFSVPFSFTISIPAILFTGALFLGILLLTLLANLRRIHVSNPIELLRGSNTGEREPKAKWLLALIGAGCLGAGYYIAITTENAMDALALYFVAVILVIIGTYCLFTAGSIVVLKLMRKNKSFYYKRNHFISVSGMLYRMKQNAVGLANICILSTMVLVMISGTLSLYLGTEDSINARYPAQICGRVAYENTKGLDKEAFLQKVENTLQENGYTLTQCRDYSILSFGAGLLGDQSFTLNVQNPAVEKAVSLFFITAEDYARYTQTTSIQLEADQVLVYDSKGTLDNTLTLEFSSEQIPNGPVRTFQIQQQLDSFFSIGRYAGYMMDSYCVVVADETVLQELMELQSAAYGDVSSDLTWSLELDIEGDDEAQMACAELLGGDQIDLTETGEWNYYMVESRAQNALEFYSLNGSFLFLGIFLGLLFIFATVLIIYYKQISEGYDDRERFRIMQQVGLTKSEVRRSISAQILWVFFLPLVVAAIHVAFDFNLVIRLLTLFNVANTKLTALCTLGTLGLFVLAYGVVYLLTSRVYYKIVS
jgi:putative ABC transport system permease protein